MPLLESFINLEQSLETGLMRAARPVLQEAELSLAQALASNDFEQAFVLADKLDLTPVMQNELGFVEQKGLESLIFGQSLIAGTTANTGLVRGDDIPIQLGIQSAALVASLSLTGSEQLREEVSALIAKLEQDGITTVEKAAVRDFLSILKNALVTTTRRVVSFGSNLFVNRLAGFGGLAESFRRDANTFQVSEKLDGKTCPVCRRMHGRTFSVPIALARIDAQLLNEDAMQLKAAQPFPRQSREGLVELTGLSKEELQARGWDVPPFHPHCRGVVVRTGTVPPSEIIPFTAPSPGSPEGLFDEDQFIT
jgi:hypothetical protein